MTRAVQRVHAGRRKGRHEHGYVLLTLLLFVSLLMIAAAVVAPSLAFQIRRDREEELVHRGVQYTRAIRNYAKRTGRYPVRTEELLGGPDVRYIRKLYKDPITGGDFKLLHLGDVQPRAANINPAGSQAAVNDDGSASGINPTSTSNPSDDTTSAPASAANSNGSQPNSLARGNTLFATPASAASSSIGGTSGSQPGLLIFGVVSKSKARSIREFDHKDHYNDWLFYYDPSVDRGYEIKGPTSRTPPTFPGQNFPGQPSGQMPGQTQPGGFGLQPTQSAPQSPLAPQPQATPQ